ncbi:MAG: sulfatase-like hydrolase/transferase [Deltaproteobacteria bacterium]|jgi:membrane-anchored protein YejM (alkaline phosphatase superfamily)|nr:sulfatase-like hydrolase/transferase [Deltaproteobacteria bacterium]
MTKTDQSSPETTLDVASPDAHHELRATPTPEDAVIAGSFSEQAPGPTDEADDADDADRGRDSAPEPIIAKPVLTGGFPESSPETSPDASPDPAREEFADASENAPIPAVTRASAEASAERKTKVKNAPRVALAFLPKSGRYLKNKWLEQKAFYVLTQVATFFLLSAYFLRAPAPASFLSAVYVASVFGYYAFCLLVIQTVLFPFTFFRYSKALVPAVVTLWFLFLTTDLFVFYFYKHHVNSLLLKVLVTDFAGVGVPLKITIAGAGAVALLFGFLTVFQHKTSEKRENRGGAPSFLAIILIPIALFGLNSIIHVWAYNHLAESVTVYDYYPPLYHPVRKSIKTPYDRLAGSVETRAGETPDLSRHVLKYPGSEPVFGENESTKKNILLIVLESFQAGNVNEETMPNLSRFAKEATSFEKHVSSGSATITGLFGLFYGVHAGMYDIAKNNPESYKSVFSKSLRDNGYELGIYTATELRRYHLKTMLFDEAELENIHNVGTDDELADALVGDIKNRDGGLFFDFLFLISSHYPYRHPKEHEIMKDLPEYDLRGFVSNRNDEWRKYKNAFFNSLHHVDALVGEVFDALKEKGLYDDAWIIVTGDHGEEFNEDGSGDIGHGSNFGKRQTGVPLLIKRPGQTTGEVVNLVTLHQDIVPTLMEEVLNTLTPTEDYANGTNLYKLTGDRGTVVYSYFDSAYVFDGVVIEKAAGKKYRWDTKEKLPGSLTPGEKRKIMALFDEELLFLRDER